MTKLVLWLNGIFLLVGLGLSYYILFNINPTEVGSIYIWILLTSFVVIIWSLFALFGYYIRNILTDSLFKNRDKSYILIRSERQGLLLGVLFGLQLALQGFLLSNILSATILTIAVFLLEFFFIAQETK